MPNLKKVALGLSGGVDSATAGWLLLKQGYQVDGVFLECWNEPGCRTDQDRQDALQVALTLGIPFKVIDFKQAYREQVFAYFRTEYAAGNTPNPDIVCNREIKFGLFYNWAMQQGYDFMATGHYADITTFDDQLKLKIPQDKQKDQTYFLCEVESDRLAHVLFPLANLLKSEVRQFSLENHLPVAQKAESMGVCFIGEFNLNSWLKTEFGENPGSVVSPNGQVIGRHSGLWFSTIGQRKGFKLDPKATARAFNLNPTQLPAFFALDKDIKHNQLVVGQKTDLLTSDLKVTALSDQLSTLLQNKSAADLNAWFIRLRHGGDLLPISRIAFAPHQPLISLTNPVSKPAPGQWGVFYQKVGPELILQGKTVFV